LRWPWSDRCEHVVNYDGINISFSGLEGPSPFNVKLGEVKANREVLQTASEIAQLYDLYQYSNCQQTKMLPENSPERTQFILEAQKNGQRLLELLSILKLLAARPSDKMESALADWVAYSFTRIEKESPLLPPGTTTRAGGATRAPPPVSELNQIRRSLAKAKEESAYLKEALRKPEFDIEKVYQS
jgi:hypothetical protein